MCWVLSRVHLEKQHDVHDPSVGDFLARSGAFVRSVRGIRYVLDARVGIRFPVADGS
ncbi:hypothetical protein GCM10023198_53440 [Promicromonospora umidemergens]|uniref:Uncharacterized protein n=1 Tax=Promicromonospora umidemergens TaxID=629679 RepID=A0ABP8Y869_9MICO